MKLDFIKLDFSHEVSILMLAITIFCCIDSEVVVRKCSVKKMFLIISQNSGLRPATLLKRESGAGVFL